MGRHEVTFDQYDTFARATGHALPSDSSWGRGDRPVINVSWKDAQAYVQWLSNELESTCSLPNEAQWGNMPRDGREPSAAMRRAGANGKRQHRRPGPGQL